MLWLIIKLINLHLFTLFFAVHKNVEQWGAKTSPRSLFIVIDLMTTTRRLCGILFCSPIYICTVESRFLEPPRKTEISSRNGR